MTHGDAGPTGMQQAWVRVGMPAAAKHLSRQDADYLYFLYTFGGDACGCDAFGCAAHHAETYGNQSRCLTLNPKS